MTHELELLAVELFSCGAYLDKSRSPEGKGFRLKLHEKTPDAPLSPFYLNLRSTNHPKNPGPLELVLINSIGKALLTLAVQQDLGFKMVGGIPHAGWPLALAFVRAATPLKREIAVVEFQKTETSSARRISDVTEDTRVPGASVLLIDDLITKADSKLEAIKAIYKANMQVAGTIVIVDREQGGAEELLNQGFQLHSLFKISDLLSCFLNHKLISKSEHDEVLKYIQSN